MEGDRASEVGDRTREEPTVVPEHLAMAPPSLDAEAATPSVGEPEALAKRQRLVLDKAYRYLVNQGFGTLELASLELSESTAQLAAG